MWCRKIDLMHLVTFHRCSFVPYFSINESDLNVCAVSFPFPCECIIGGLRPGSRYVNELTHSADRGLRPPTMPLSKADSSFSCSSI